MGSDPVKLRAVLGPLRGVDAAEPIGGRAQTVAIVVDQGMLGGQARSGAIELGDLAAGQEERFEKGDLAVFVQIRARVRDRLREVLSESGEVLFIAAPGRCDDDAVRRREPAEERAARGGAIRVSRWAAGSV